MHWNWSRIAYVVAGLCLGCGFEPTGDVSIQPPSRYREWWARTEICSGRSGSFDRVQWFVVPGHGFSCPSGRCAGRWETTHRIYLSEDFQANELVVRHEMLHDLIGHPGHPDPPFGIGCPLTWSSWVGDRAALGPAPEAPDSVQID